MELSEVTKLMLAAKAKSMLTFADLAAQLGLDEICVAAIFYRQATASEAETKQLTAILGLDDEAAAKLMEFPTKGLGPVVPTDPFVYRLYEVIQVYGFPLKSVVQEKFGDGIMSAVDFTMHVEKEKKEGGDRIVLTMNGKFLPYKKW